MKDPSWEGEERLSEPAALPPPPAAAWKAMEQRVLGEARARAARTRAVRYGRWGGLVAAAAVLAVILLRPSPDRYASVPELSHAPMATIEPSRWPVGESAVPGRALYLAPDCWVEFHPDAVARRLAHPSEARLRLERGGMTWVNRGWTAVTVETVAGRLKPALDGDLEAELSLGPGADPGVAGLLLRSAAASDGPLHVAVYRGALVLERPGEAPVTVAAGRSLTLAPSGDMVWADVAPRPAPQPLVRRFDPPRAVVGDPGSLPLELPVGGAYVWEAEVRERLPSSSFGMVFPTSSRIRFWHLGVPLAGSSAWHRLRVVVRGDWAEGWVDGKLVISTDRAGSRFQDPPVAAPSLVVWGEGEVRSLSVSILP